MIRAELVRICGSPEFRNSKRYPAFLEYVVEETLEGRQDEIKERNVGVAVFHRQPDYDTNDDTVVRFTAGEVRKRLSLYNSRQSGQSQCLITLPSGSYVPMIERAVSGVAASLSRDVPDLPAAVSRDAEVSQLSNRRRLWMPAVAVLLLLAIGAGIYLIGSEKSRLIWDTFLPSRLPVVICHGSVIFSSTQPRKEIPADRNVAYPFVTQEMAGAVALLSEHLAAGNVSYKDMSSSSVTLADLSEQPSILIGAYDNEWTQRLLHNYRFQFSDEPVESIMDTKDPSRRWARNHSIPYAKSDDYAIVLRSHDPTTDAPLLIVAGLGRNGTEAAANFVFSPRAAQLLTKKLGTAKWTKKNLEIVLHVPVIDGKTGPAWIEQADVW